MKYTTSTSSTNLFCEQVGTVTGLFEKWNNCERTVVLYALLKRIAYTSLKFLQVSIESNLTQNFSLQTKAGVLEQNANCPSYLRRLVDTYKNFPNIGELTAPLTSKDFALYESDSYLAECESIYDKKEDILEEFLVLLQMLKPGNDEAKSIYLSLIPLAVEDTAREVVGTTELVQQIFSYLLIHPAISNDDRRSLSQWLRHLENHIHSTFNAPSQSQSYYSLNSVSANPNEKVAMQSSSNTSTSSLHNCINSAGSGSSSGVPPSAHAVLPMASWQAIAPPIQSSHKSISTSSSSSTTSSHGSIGSANGGTVGVGTQPNASSLSLTGLATTSQSTEWDLGLLQMQPPTFCEEIVLADLSSATAAAVAAVSTNHQQHTLGLIFDSNNSHSSNEDHHVSFSKNGTEILDFDDETNDKSNTQIAFDAGCLPTSFSEHLNIPLACRSSFGGNSAISHSDNFFSFSDSDSASVKTRRSNSLTTPVTSSPCNRYPYGVNANYSNSNENLAQFAQKQRSFSLSMESPRQSLSTSGSDTRLDDLKPNYLKFTTHNIGMANIAQWLKSLRLHKYVWLFTNMTYEQMMDITEDYLQNLGVTKGASHKLALCIEKLKERVPYMMSMEKDMLSGNVALSAVVEELTNIVLSPMKPADMSSKDNVAGQFLRLLDICITQLNKKLITTSTDEDTLSALLWTLEKCIHSESFVAQTNILKEHKFKLSKIKMQLVPKGHYSKNNQIAGSLNKPRWTSGNKPHKLTNSVIANNAGPSISSQQSSSIDKTLRKNSNGMPNFNINSQPTASQSTLSSSSSNVSNIQSSSISSHNLEQEKFSIANVVTQLQNQHLSYAGYAGTNHSQQQMIVAQQQPQSALVQQMIAAGPSLSSTSQYNKSSSYPNFSSSQSSKSTINGSVQVSSQQLQQQHQQQQHQIHQQHLKQQQLQQQQPQYRHHRHSLSNLIVLSGNPQQQQHVQFKQGKQTAILMNPRNQNLELSSSSLVSGSVGGSGIAGIAGIAGSSISAISAAAAGGIVSNVPKITTAVAVKSQLPSNSCTGTTVGGSNKIIGSSGLLDFRKSNEKIANGKSNNNNNNKNNNGNTSSIGDINSSLEFLCLQMTEQAIN